MLFMAVATNAHHSSVGPISGLRGSEDDGSYHSKVAMKRCRTKEHVGWLVKLEAPCIKFSVC